MSTKHVILGLLDIKPATGYDLMSNMKISLNSLWSATFSQIYTTLHKLENDKLVKSKKGISKKGRETIRYSITNKGSKELQHWINTEVKYLPYRDPFKLWASYIDNADPALIKKNIQQHIEKNQERALFLRGIANSIMCEEHPLIQERSKVLKKEELEKLKVVKSKIFRELELQARAEVASAKRILQLADELE